MKLGRNVAIAIGYVIASLIVAAPGGGVQPLTPATGTTYNAYRIGFSAPSMRPARRPPPTAATLRAAG